MRRPTGVHPTPPNLKLNSKANAGATPPRAVVQTRYNFQIASNDADAKPTEKNCSQNNTCTHFLQQLRFPIKNKTVTGTSKTILKTINSRTHVLPISQQICLALFERPRTSKPFWANLAQVASKHFWANLHYTMC